LTALTYSQSRIVNRQGERLVSQADHMPNPIKASEFDGNLSEYLDKYRYQPKLTPRLDDLAGSEFTQETVNEIVLWKVNRFVGIDGELLRRINDLRELKPCEHQRAESLLVSLLKVHGIDVSMASTLLRFRNPAVFQIIDQHAFRALYGSNFPKTTVVAMKIRCYFDYLDELVKLCNQKKLRFEMVDRVLYEFDRAKNGKLKADHDS
jgi:hypothetical protein